MGKVYAAPAECKVPQITFGGRFDWDTYNKACDKFTADVVAWAKAHSRDPLAGEILRFAVADGHAEYVVLSTKPVKLIHLEVGDAWHFQHIGLMTAAAIKKQVKAEKKWAKMFTEGNFVPLSAI